MNKRLAAALALIIGLVVILPGVVIASETSEAAFSATVRATNNSTATENVCGTLSINTAEWIENGILNASANNTAAVALAGADVAFQPGYDTNPWCFWFDEIPEDSYTDERLYTGGNVTGGSLAYFPGSTGMSVSDHADLEPGDNFTQGIYCYITPNGSDYIIHKDEALDVYPSGGDIVCDVTTNYMVPDGVGDATNIPNVVGAATHWEAVDDAVGSQDGLTTRVGSALDVNWYTDYYNLEDLEIPETANVTAITVYYWGYGTIANTKAKPILRLDSTDTAGSEDTLTAGSWNLYSQELARPGGGNWAVDDINDLQVGISVKGLVTGTAEITSIYAVIKFDDGLILENPPEGLYIVSIHAASGNITLELEDTEYTVTMPMLQPIPDNSNVWYYGYAAATPYICYVRAYDENNDLEMSIAWEYGATFTDLTGNGHTATPTFRTATSDADVSLSLLDFGVYALSQTDSGTSQTWGEMVADAPDEPDTWATEEDRPGLFFEPLLYHLSAAAGIPESLFWYLIAFTSIIISGMLTFWAFAKNNQASLFIKFLTMMVLMIAWAVPGVNVYGFYVVIYFIFWSIGILVLSRSYGW